MSDVHGEYGKLRHVINNAAGSLRPAVAALLNHSLTDAEQRQLLSVIYYPGETIAQLRPTLIDEGTRTAWIRRTLQLQFELVRLLSRSWRREDYNALLPAEFSELFKELYTEPMHVRPPELFDAILSAYESHDRDFAAVRAASRLVRNLSAMEILVAGDLGDRGPRIDKVIEILQQQPNASIVWGNHDAHWMGACLGHEACIASVLRFSLRYRRLDQLEEGYGVSLLPLEDLARDVYGDDPATQFALKGQGTRDAQLLARMQKAIAIIGFKLEGQMFARNPNWNLASRALMNNIDLSSGTVTVNGKAYPLLDTRFPTLDPENPNALSPAEQTCVDALRASFIASPRLWQQMSWVVRRGCMWTTRDDLLIFHACVPTDAAGTPLPLEVDGRPRAGRELFDALAQVIRRAFRAGADSLAPADGDWLWYLWCGPLSPLFGKDKIATFESSFIADEATHKERKNPYFDLINDAAFVRKIAALFGCGDDALVVNGHVPVKMEKGEQPVKRGGNAITIDGAFSQAYGDHGYSLLQSATGITLAEHSHFDSVEATIREGKDIVPKLTSIRTFTPPKRFADTQQGDRARDQIHQLDNLINAYEDGTL
jgi:fructose-1,6-bisphosphatase-3